MTFPCTRCGLCCQKLDKVVELKKYDRGDGVCKHYRQDSSCMIYGQRPMACRIDEGYVVFASDQISLEQYYRANAQECNKLQEEAGFSPSWRVIL